MSNKMFKVLKSMIALVMCSILLIPYCVVSHAAGSLLSYDLQYLPAVSNSETAKCDVYVVALSDGTKSSRESTYKYTRACGDDEIVAYYLDYSTSCSLGLLSKSKFIKSENSFDIYANGNTQLQNTAVNVSSINKDEYQYMAAGIDRASSTERWETNGSLASNTYVFKDYESAATYLETGVLSNCIKEPDKSFDGSGVYLDNFQMVVYDSNVFENYYLQFKYNIPECLKDCSNLKLNINSYYTYQLTGLSGIVPEDYSYYGEPDCVIDINANSDGFILKLSDINAINQFINDKDYQCGEKTTKRRLLGGMGAISLLCSLGDALAKIDKSYLQLSCTVIANGVWGIEYAGDVDFLSGANSMSTYTPDTSGEYIYNDDYENQGRYFTEIGTDAAGNTTYNYYYYDTSGEKTKTDASGSGVDVNTGNVTQINNNSVNVPDSINITVNGSLSGNGSSSTPNFDNVTIEDDDLSFKSLADVMKSGFGIVDDVDTDIKGDGFPAMLAYLYQGLPDKFIQIILLGVSSITGIALILRLFNR